MIASCYRAGRRQYGQNVDRYAGLLYRELYRGIDLVLPATNNGSRDMMGMRMKNLSRQDVEAGRHQPVGDTSSQHLWPGSQPSLC